MTNKGELTIHSKANVPSSHEMMVYQTMANQAVSSKMYRGIGDESGVMMIMLSARELGIPPMQALNGGLNIIQGKVEISARLMSALIRKAGHQIQVKTSTDLECVLEGIRADTGEKLTTSFSVAEAQKAGLVKPGGGWVKWPKDMCFARALSRLARQLFSDVIGIGYVEGEIKEAEAVVIDSIQPEPMLIEEDNAQFNEYFSLFTKEDRHLATEYLKHIMKHFNWSQDKALEEMLKSKDKIHEKFLFWKNKHKL